MSEIGGVITAATAEKEREDQDTGGKSSEGKGVKCILKAHSGASGVARPGAGIMMKRELPIPFGAKISTEKPGTAPSGAHTGGSHTEGRPKGYLVVGGSYWRGPAWRRSSK